MKRLKFIKKLFGKKEIAPRCSAVIVAAGSSTRMGEDKMFMQLGDMPVLARTLKVFESCRAVEEIIVVTRSEKLTEVADMCKQYGISKASKVIIGGKTRVESSLAGASEGKSDAEIIAIHDGARPLVTEDIIEKTVEAVTKYPAAAPAVKSTDTLKRIDEKGFAVKTVDRNATVRIQTPQVFRADIIKGALSKAVRDNSPITDDCSAIETFGMKIFLTEGSEDNIKLTTARDMIIAETVLKSRE